MEVERCVPHFIETWLASRTDQRNLDERGKGGSVGGEEGVSWDPELAGDAEDLDGHHGDICNCVSLKDGFRSFAIMQFGFANLPFSNIAILLQYFSPFSFSFWVFLYLN
jgi:hypothetical protein